jgi:hypothetical protein
MLLFSCSLFKKKQHIPYPYPPTDLDTGVCQEKHDIITIKF